MLPLLTLLATAALATAAPFDIESIASNKAEIADTFVAAAASKAWTRVVTEAPWSSRAGGNLEFMPGSSQFIMHGVGIYDQDDEALEEVWVGNSRGVFPKQPVKMTTPFTPLYSALSTQDKNGVQYRIQGNDASKTTVYDDVWRSENGGKTWTAQHSKSNKRLESCRYLGAAVALVSDPTTLMIWGGQCDNDILADVWKSGDSGKTWTEVLTQEKNVFFGPRSVNIGLATTMGTGEDAKDVVYQITGYRRWDSVASRGVYSNDVWVSAGSAGARGDIGKKWYRIQQNAPWIARGDATADITDNGVLIVSSGIASYGSDEDEVMMNDVWASLDGGYSWGLCHKDAEFSDRRFQYTAIDGEGFMWIMGGRDADNNKLNDIWKSAESYTDIEKVAEICNLLVPSCGAGLKCLPDSEGFRSGLWGVTCDACPSTPSAPNTPGNGGSSSSSGMSSMWTVAFVIVVIVAVGAAAAAYHFYRKSSVVAVGSDSQAWWGKNGTETLVGGDAQAPSDAMYNPLNIRDSNATM